MESVLHTLNPNDELYKLYTRLVKTAEAELKLKKDETESFRSESDKIGIDYGDTLRGYKLEFSLHLRTETKNSVLEFTSLRILVFLKNEFGGDFFQDEIRISGREHLKEIERLFKDKLLLARREELNELKYYFGDFPFIKVGEEGISVTAQLFDIVLKGYFQPSDHRYLKRAQEKVIVWRITHGIKPYCDYSFVVRLDHWLIVFPNFCGDQGGEGRRSRDAVMKTISEMKSKDWIELIDLEVEIDEFHDFFNKYDKPFSDRFKHEIEDNAWKLKKLIRSKVVSKEHRDMGNDLRFLLKDISEGRYSSIENRNKEILEALTRNYYLIKELGSPQETLMPMVETLVSKKMIDDITRSYIIFNQRNIQLHGQPGEHIEYPLLYLMLHLSAIRKLIENYIRYEVLLEILPQIDCNWKKYGDINAYSIDKDNKKKYAGICFSFKIMSYGPIESGHEIEFEFVVDKVKIGGQYNLEQDKVIVWREVLPHETSPNQKRIS